MLYVNTLAMCIFSIYFLIVPVNLKVLYYLVSVVLIVNLFRALFKLAVYAKSDVPE